ncbi:MAG: ABC transporter ATP-binding protein [Bacteroides sp.]
MTTIQLHHLSIGYRGKHHTYPVASGLDASLYGGQLTCLLGANGVGKSTLLRTLSAFLPPLEGEITLLDKPLQSYTDKELARALSVVLTERIDVPDLRVSDVVALGRTPYTGFLGGLSSADEEHVSAALEATGITHLAQRKLHTLSDGERQKTMIAKALAQDTPLIFLDEPTAFLDYPSKVEMMQLLHRLSRTMQKTIFLSTHDLDLALQLADCVWLLDAEGHLTTGLPEALILDGTLPRFFRSEGVSFDSTTGHFSVIHRPTRSTPILTTGTGLPLLMLRRALQRQGFLMLQEGAADLSVDAREDSQKAPHFTLTKQPGHAPQHYPTLPSLLDALESLT